MFNTFHVAKYAHSIALVKATIDDTPIRSSTGQWFGVAWFEKENVCSGILCAEVNMTENTCANFHRLSSVENQIRINVHDSGPLMTVSRWLAEVEESLTIIIGVSLRTFARIL